MMTLIRWCVLRTLYILLFLCVLSQHFSTQFVYSLYMNENAWGRDEFNEIRKRSFARFLEGFRSLKWRHTEVQVGRVVYSAEVQHSSKATCAILTCFFFECSDGSPGGRNGCITVHQTCSVLAATWRFEGSARRRTKENPATAPWQSARFRRALFLYWHFRQ